VNRGVCDFVNFLMKLQLAIKEKRFKFFCDIAIIEMMISLYICTLQNIFM